MGYCFYTSIFFDFLQLLLQFLLAKLKIQRHKYAENGDKTPAAVCRTNAELKWELLKTDSEITYEGKHLLQRGVDIWNGVISHQYETIEHSTINWHVSSDWRFYPRDHPRRHFVPVDLVNIVATYVGHSAGSSRQPAIIRQARHTSQSVGCRMAPNSISTAGPGWLENHRHFPSTPSTTHDLQLEKH